VSKWEQDRAAERKRIVALPEKLRDHRRVGGCSTACLLCEAADGIESLLGENEALDELLAATEETP